MAKPPRTPIWQSIAMELRRAIAAGHYAPGERLPTEAGLAARFGVNRHTVRHALAALSDEGLILTRRGAGAFVAYTPTDYPIGRRVRFHQNLQAAGKIPGRQILSLETRTGDTEDRAMLALPPGAQVHVCDGLSLADDQPLAVFRSIFPAARFPDLPAQLAQTRSVTAALALSGVADYTRASTRISAALATTTQALHLRLREGAAILRTVSVNVDAAGTPVEYGQTWFAGDRVTLTLSAA